MAVAEEPQVVLVEGELVIFGSVERLLRIELWLLLEEEGEVSAAVLGTEVREVEILVLLVKTVVMDKDTAETLQLEVQVATILEIPVNRRVVVADRAAQADSVTEGRVL